MPNVRQMPAGLAGFLLAQQQGEQSDMNRLQQTTVATGLMAALQKAQQEKAFRGDLDSLGPNPDQKSLAAVASKYAAPDALMRTQQSSLDRQATADATKAMREATVAQQKHAADLMHEYRMRGAKTDEQRANETARHNKVLEGIQSQLVELRGAGQAPSLSEIVDPTSPGRMLRIDARKYKGGGLGSPGVFGVSGKEPVAAKREAQEGLGKDLLRTELDNLRVHYGVLNDARAIPSEDRGAASNAAAWVQGSTIGQIGGRVIGTKEQGARNQIQSARLRILNAIKSATGMSARQLDSNTELKTWLDSLTSMTGSYESNVGIIDAIENAFLSGKGKGGAGTAPPGGFADPEKERRYQEWKRQQGK